MTVQGREEGRFYVFIFLFCAYKISIINYVPKVEVG